MKTPALPEESGTTHEPAGRAPAGLEARRGSPCEPALGAYFADVAYLEEASIVAFRRLERELRAHGAPEGLRRRARRSVADEGRHTNTMRILARRFGGRPARPRVARERGRSLADLARENLVEGALAETFGALVNHHQAAHASDAAVREAYREIAADETRHASLAWAIHAWLWPRLSPDERASLVTAFDAAVARLLAGTKEPCDELRAVAGLPAQRESRRLLTGLAAALRSRVSGGERGSTLARGAGATFVCAGRARVRVRVYAPPDANPAPGCRPLLCGAHRSDDRLRSDTAPAPKLRVS